MRTGTSGIRDCSNFILFIIFFFSGTMAVVSYLAIGKPQWLGKNCEPVDLAIYGFMACAVVGALFFLRSLKRRGVF